MFALIAGGRIAERKATWQWKLEFRSVFLHIFFTLLCVAPILSHGLLDLTCFVWFVCFTLSLLCVHLQVSMAQLQHFFLACHRQGFDAVKAINLWGYDQSDVFSVCRHHNTSATLPSTSPDLRSFRPMVEVLKGTANWLHNKTLYLQHADSSEERVLAYWASQYTGKVT